MPKLSVFPEVACISATGLVKRGVLPQEDLRTALSALAPHKWLSEKFDSFCSQGMQPSQTAKCGSTFWLVPGQGIQSRALPCLMGWRQIAEFRGGRA